MHDESSRLPRLQLDPGRTLPGILPRNVRGEIRRADILQLETHRGLAAQKNLVHGPEVHQFQPRLETLSGQCDGGGRRDQAAVHPAGESEAIRQRCVTAAVRVSHDALVRRARVGTHGRKRSVHRLLADEKLHRPKDAGGCHQLDVDRLPGHKDRAQIAHLGCRCLRGLILPLFLLGLRFYIGVSQARRDPPSQHQRRPSPAAGRENG